MKYIIATLIFLVIAAAIIGCRCIYNAVELRRLKRSGYRKIATKRHNRGSVDADFLRCLAELTLLLLMLAAVFGWLAHGTPH